MYGHGHISKPVEKEKCPTCGNELVRSSEAYLACPKMDSKLVKASQFNGHSYPDGNKVVRELREFDNRLRSIFKIKPKDRVYYLGETSAQWMNRLKKEAAKETVPARMTIEIEYPDGTKCRKAA